MAAVGIYLGTTNCCAAFWRNGKVEVIVDEQGNRTTPSYIAFTETNCLIGESARNQAAINPGNTIFGAKRLIGRQFDDIGLQRDLCNWPFKVLNTNGKPMISVDFKNEKKKFAAEEISSMVIFRMKQIAEAYIGIKVDQAVITVPAYFNDAQRQATRTAGTIAGLKVLGITNEPTAAALAYGLDKNLGDKNVLIYHLGGGTFDVAVLKIGNSVHQVKASSGNSRLGGDNFDSRIVAYFTEDFRKHFNKDITGNSRSKRRLKFAAEMAKRSLTSATEAVVTVKSLFNNIDYSGKISRELFEELCSDLFLDTLKPIDKVLLGARLDKLDISRVILVGGSTRIPKVQSLLKDFFKGVPLTTSINPEEAVACGAAIQAAVISGDRQRNINNSLVFDVVPLSLGVETARGVMFKVVERNTVIPCSKTKDLTTLEDNQSTMTIEIFEGERSLTKDNNLLGAFHLNGIPQAPRGVVKVDVTFEVDLNGILSVTARDRITGIAERVIIRNEQRLKQTYIRKMLADAEVFRDEDIEEKRRLDARNQLETYIYNIKHTVNITQVLSHTEKTYMLEQCSLAVDWLEEHGDSLREEFERKMSELMHGWSDTMKKIHNALQPQAKRRRTES
ncbi:Heat shock protein 70-p4 [Operophtera brumata]|uniref:Heat shock protein 70-p4 n=1 Tax=Operophtera brumata TaxID=104452 RepID=A0A0L7LGD6_OPEBR|nr:Heat shock protein 70-p4 [Operophtera brumata]